MTSDGRPPRKPTRHDVAVLAGVSDAVVSYTLNGGAPVAPATAERVREAVRVLGYRPNRTARALKSGSAGAIALLAPRAGNPPATDLGATSAFANPFLTEFAAVVAEAARRRGYALYLASYAVETESVVDRLHEFADRQVDGALLVAGGPETPPEAAAVDAIGIPWVQVNTSDPLPRIASVGPDLHAGAVLVTEHLAGHGHDRIGFVGQLGSEHRHRGWLDACRRLGVVAGPAEPAPFSHEGGYLAGRRLIAGGDVPPALFAASDRIAVGLLRALHESGLAVPERVAVASFDGSWQAEYAWPPLTSVRQPIEEMAEAALTRLLSPGGDPRSHASFPGTLVVRASCGCR